MLRPDFAAVRWFFHHRFPDVEYIKMSKIAAQHKSCGTSVKLAVVE
jgi:hypothetical protein